MLLDKLKQQQGAAFVLHDPIGITQELNDFRNAALEGIEHYLAATDPYGASNQQRLRSRTQRTCSSTWRKAMQST